MAAASCGDVFPVSRRTGLGAADVAATAAARLLATNPLKILIAASGSEGWRASVWRAGRFRTARASAHDPLCLLQARSLKNISPQ